MLAADRTDEKGNPLPAKIVLILLRADHDLNEVKAGHLPELKDGFRFATDAEILENFGSKPGYLGPVGIKEDVAVYADLTVANMSDFCCGANEEGYHYTGVNFGRDLPEPKVADLRNVVEGDASPRRQGACSACSAALKSVTSSTLARSTPKPSTPPISMKTASRRFSRWAATASA